MEHSFKVKILSPEKPLATIDAYKLQVPGSKGQLGILPLHANLISNLKPGVMEVVGAPSRESYNYFVSGGYVTIIDNEATVLVEVIETPDQIDHDRVLSAESRALKRLSDTSGRDINIGRALVSLARARARKKLLSLTNKTKH